MNEISATAESTPARRRSVFQEIGLEEVQNKLGNPSTTEGERPRTLRFRSKPDVYHYSSEDGDLEFKEGEKRRLARAGKDTTPTSVLRKTTPPNTQPERDNRFIMYRFGAAAFALAVALPLLQNMPWLGHTTAPAIGAEGGPIPKTNTVIIEDQADKLARRDNSPDVVCTRWGQQCEYCPRSTILRANKLLAAVVNGTLYMYGGQATTQAGQTDNTWSK